jgi:hypothetical protein
MISASSGIETGGMAASLGYQAASIGAWRLKG